MGDGLSGYMRTPDGRRLDSNAGTPKRATIGRPTVPLGIGQGMGLEDQQFFVFGVNLGLTNTGTASYLDFWTNSWTEEWVDLNMARIANLGANLVRVTGQYRAYAFDPEAFATKYRYTLEAARRHGLKVLYSFVNVGGRSEEWYDVDYVPAYKAMIDDLMSGYIDDPMIFAWDVINDGIYNDLATEDRAIALALLPYVKSADPGTLVCASAQTIEHAIVPAIIDASDFVALNYYLTGPMMPDQDLVGPDAFHRIRRETSKPVLLTELGANSNGTGNGPAVNGVGPQAAYIAAFRKKLVRSDVMGAVLHKITDPPAGGNAFGIYDGAGNPKPAALEASLFPTERMAAVADYVDSAAVRVVLDNFTRANSASAVGAPPVGPSAPTAQVGTWGITSKAGYLAANAGSSSNILTWEARACDVRVETEVYTTALPIVAGLVLRWVDADNYTLVRYGTNDASGSGGITIYERIAGVTAQRGQIQPANLGLAGRLSAMLVGSTIVVFVNGRQVAYETLAQSSTATQHGVFINPTAGDASTRLRRFSVGISPRRY